MGPVVWVLPMSLSVMGRSSVTFVKVALFLTLTFVKVALFLTLTFVKVALFLTLTFVKVVPQSCSQTMQRGSLAAWCPHLPTIGLPGSTKMPFLLSKEKGLEKKKHRQTRRKRKERRRNPDYHLKT